jgi:Rrf2 family protein
MAASCRFAFAVHILAVLARQRKEGVTSEALARSVNTNAVVIRRILADLRRAGLVTTHKGAKGGAWLAADPDQISLDSVYRAVLCGSSFSLHPHQPNQRCPVGRKIEEVLEGVFASAEAALERALAGRTLAEVLEDVAAREEGDRIEV